MTVFERSGIRLSAAIMTHPSRSAWAEQLRSTCPELGLVVVTDPDPTGPPATLRTARLAWQSVSDEATHHLVFQDDVIMCPGFVERLVAAILGRPSDALSLFCEWAGRSANVVRLAALTGHCYAEAVEPYVPSPALVLPADVARGFVGWVDDNATATDPDDVVMLRYLTAIGVRNLVTAPNLVDHDIVPSLMGNSSQGARRATWLATDGADPAFGGAALTGLLAVPYLSFLHPVGTCLVRTTPRSPWRAEPAADTLRGYGIDAVTAAYAEASARPAIAGDELCERFGRRPVAGVWTTAVTIGVLAARIPMTGRLAGDSAALERSVMFTLARGGLRMIGDERQLERLAGRFTELAMAGLDHGRRAAAAAATGTGAPLAGPVVSSAAPG
jgi:hypothetical protein